MPNGASISYKQFLLSSYAFGHHGDVMTPFSSSNRPPQTKKIYIFIKQCFQILKIDEIIRVHTSFIFQTEPIAAKWKVTLKNYQNLSRCGWIWRWCSKATPSSDFRCIFILSIVNLSNNKNAFLEESVFHFFPPPPINCLCATAFDAYFNIIKITIGTWFQIKWQKCQFNSSLISTWHLNQIMAFHVLRILSILNWWTKFTT